MSMMELFHQGGFIMYPLLVFSILAWTVATHKIFFLRAFIRESEKLNQEINQAIASRRFDDLKHTLKRFPESISRPYEVLMEETHTSKEDMADKLSRRLSETNSSLKENLWILGTIASSAPFVGLFGTVLGIMASFKAIGATGKSGFSVVAAGISESLIATAAGIIVAVIAVLFYNYFQTKVNKTAQSFRHQVEDIAELVLLARKTK
ncbi:MotA/TolQ/ExbB proton channel family protein [Peredibacter starrii]|uniref:MotA/TolQ/ExbB proton channel family protein n=1 Tax=Peredibacter starrii TaxID=28202 RepID=A0AAX4HUQ3_9BACT|nr:MotA/TolQ/ExbB proton channel family protein [Peredibacter starrii]WPU66905.1 MotA/TolQ/ExbB proton channel family protein [Peredibacter starrii]